MTRYRKASELLRAARAEFVFDLPKSDPAWKVRECVYQGFPRDRWMWVTVDCIDHILDLAIAERERAGD